MKLLQLSDSVEVSGQTLYAILTNLQADQLEPMRKLFPWAETLDPTAWYPQRYWRDVFEWLLGKPDAMTNLVAVGMRIGNIMDLPSGCTTLAEVLLNWDSLYHLHHRNGEIGHVRSTQIGPKYIRVAHPAAYPDHFLYGMAYGLARRLRPPTESFTVRYPHPEECEEDPTQYVVLDVLWGNR